MIETPDIPRDELCHLVNFSLFKYFQLQQLKMGLVAATNWTEAEVVQWLDTELIDIESDIR